MANTLKHRFVSPVADAGNANEVGPSEWNDEHVFAGGTDGAVLVRDSAETDGINWTTRPELEAVTFPLTALSSPADGQVWVEASGTSPTEVWYIKGRFNGTTRTLLTITF